MRKSIGDLVEKYGWCIKCVGVLLVLCATILKGHTSQYQLEKLEASKCKELRYAGFIYCHKLSNMNFFGCEHMTWVNASAGCLKFTKAGVKAPSATKITWKKDMTKSKGYKTQMKLIQEACDL